MSVDELPTLRTPPAHANHVRSSVRSRGIYVTRGKRLIDVVGAGIVLLVALPVIAVIACAIRIRLGSPLLFSEARAGRDGRPFLLRKFRTMSNDTDVHGRLLPDEKRLTAFGRLLRRSSVDELPELVHVLRGEMSLVGPRPLPMRYVDRYSDGQARRLAATPGITGLAQVRGRNSLSWEEKFALDVWYVDHCSFLLDARVLLATAAVVVRGHGVSQPGHATMEEFAGSPPRRNSRTVCS